MPIQSTWESDIGHYKKFTGKVNFDDIIQANTEIMGDERIDSLRWLIVDWLDIKDTDLDIEKMKLMANYDRHAAEMFKGLKIAIVSTDETIQALSLLYDLESPGAPWKMQVFSSLSDARQWVSQ